MPRASIKTPGSYQGGGNPPTQATHLGGVTIDSNEFLEISYSNSVFLSQTQPQITVTNISKHLQTVIKLCIECSSILEKERKRRNLTMHVRFLCIGLCLGVARPAIRPPQPSLDPDGSLLDSRCKPHSKLCFERKFCAQIVAATASMNSKLNRKALSDREIWNPTAFGSILKGC